MHSRCSALPFSLSLVARSPTDAKRHSDALPCGRCPRGCASRHAPLVYNCGPSPRMECLHARKDVIARLHGSARLWLCGLLGFVSLASSLTQHGLHCASSRLSVALYLILRLDKVSLSSSAPYCVIASNTSSVA